MNPTIKVTQLNSSTQYWVRVDLDPGSFIDAIAAVAIEHADDIGQVSLEGDISEGAYRVAFGNLERALDGVLHLLLSPEESEAAGAEFYEASIEPDKCEHCDIYGATVVDGINLCKAHADALDMAEALSGEPS